MLDAITTQFPQPTRQLTERSIAATAGVLFGVVVASTLGLLAHRVPFALDPAMLALYGSVIPLSVAGFMVKFSKGSRLPMLATLWFLALFVPGLALTEMFSMGQELHIGGLALPSVNFVGFRAIVVAVMSGLIFTGVKADGSFGDELAKETKTTATAANKVDWQRRHDEAVRRLAMVDVDLRQQNSEELRALAAFDALLGAQPDQDSDDEWSLKLEEEVGCESEENVSIAA